MKKIVGIICEYNPLHNGHIHHIEEIRKQANPDILIAVISSSFTMRGDLSIYDKFTKAKQALQASVDVVIELPLALTLQRADIFADNSVKLLNMLKASEIWIGSEQNNTIVYEEYYNKIAENKEEILDEYNSGSSYKSSFNMNLLSNDILGYSYYKSIKDNNFSIKLNTIKRIGNNYLDENPNSYIASALSIRNNLNDISLYTPEFVYSNKNILDENLLFPFIKYKILSTTPEELKRIFFCDEGIEYKLKDIYRFNSYNEFIDYLSNKRYTKSRIKRMLVYILLNITKDEINNIYNTPIDFIRILAYSPKGLELIKENKKDINIYTNIKEGINPILDIELRVSKLLDSIYNLNLLAQEQKGPVRS